MNSLSGATIISCFLDLILKNVRSFDGSKSLTTLLALSAKELISPAYCTVVVLSNVDLIGIPVICNIEHYSNDLMLFLKKYLQNLQQLFPPHLCGIGSSSWFLQLQLETTIKNISYRVYFGENYTIFS